MRMTHCGLVKPVRRLSILLRGWVTIFEKPYKRQVQGGVAETINGLYKTEVTRVDLGLASFWNAARPRSRP
jgi:hypothetical protein